jgi:hypothetical protein
VTALAAPVAPVVLAAGTGTMAEPLKAAGALVYCSDDTHQGYPLDACFDYTLPLFHPKQRFDWTITNPPYGGRSARLAKAFIRTGVMYIGEHGGGLALLLPVDFDSGVTRRQWFADCPLFAGKIILTKRIIWFTRDDGRDRPKPNHAWYLWDASWSGSPIIRYAASPACKYFGR